MLASKQTLTPLWFSTPDPNVGRAQAQTSNIWPHVSVNDVTQVSVTHLHHYVVAIYVIRCYKYTARKPNSDGQYHINIADT